MFVALKNRIQSSFLPERELKKSERGTVYLLREKGTGRRYVLHHFHGSAEVYDTLRDVECPNLPHVEGVAERDGQVLVLEEYIQGDTLAFLLEERPLKEEQAREILIQVCHGLKTLHALGVVHRDVKPENIILRGEEAVLIDFDASRVSKPERNTDTRVMGTTGYAAPEQFGFSQTDARADIFALGVLLNEMLTRQHPARELASGVLRPVIEKCIEVNVDKRYASVDELLFALTEYQSKGKKHRKLWWLLPAIAAVVAVVLVAIRFGPNFAAQPDGENIPEQPGETQTLVSPDRTEFSALQATEFSWHGDPNVCGTTFWYDLDGNGEREEYVFAGMFDFAGTPELLQDSGSDINEKPEVLAVAPAVWKKSTDGKYEPVEEFAPRLSECAVTLRKNQGENEAIVEQIDPLYGVWSGSIRATFEYEGHWYYEFSATLEGETLRAGGATRTELTAEPETTTEMAERKPFEMANHTTFGYDLDGDGREEEYLFGAAFNINDGANLIWFDHTEFQRGETYVRIVAPAVWREIGKGVYERIDDFAARLENPQVTLRQLSGEVQPTVQNVEDVENVFGPWKGAIQAVYSDEGVWAYELSAVLDGQKLTAAAVTETHFALDK